MYPQERFRLDIDALPLQTILHPVQVLDRSVASVLERSLGVLHRVREIRRRKRNRWLHGLQQDSVAPVTFASRLVYGDTLLHRKTCKPPMSKE